MMKAASSPERTVARTELPTSRIRPLDGIVFSGHPCGRPRGAANWVSDTWVLAFSEREQIADFFLEDEAGPASGELDPMPWVCRAVKSDGTVVLGCVNLRNDHFLSEIFSATEEKE